jgi:Tol biopolymer transport system component
LVLLCASAGALALVSAPALAAVKHQFLSSFDGHETPAGGFLPSSFDELHIAVDDSGSASAGEVYVADRTAKAIDKFSSGPGSSYLCQITGAGSSTASLSECDSSSLGSPTGPFETPTDVAVDPATGDVYVREANSSVIEKFNPAGAYVSEIAGLSSPEAFAIDRATGDVYISVVASGQVRIIQKFDPSTSELTTFATGTPEGPLNGVTGVAVDNSAGPSAGDVYVGEANGVNPRVDKFNPAGEYQSHLSATPSGPFQPGQISLAVDPSSGDLYVADEGGAFSGEANGVVDQFDASGGFLGQLSGSQTTSGSIRPSSVAVAASGEVYVTDQEHSIVDVFGPGEVIPDVVTGAATEVQPTTVTLEGSVNPDGVQLSDCRFEYGTDAFYGQSAPCVPAAGLIAADSVAHAVTAHVTGLEAGVTYHYRLAAVNANGPNYGQDATFSTLPPPSIDSAVATGVTVRSADLTAKIDPNGYDTAYRFEWGASTAYGTSVPVPDEDIGAGTSDVATSHHIVGLSPGTTYHWRVVATNANGTRTGADHTFVYDTTGGGLPDNRAYEMVSPPQKNGALLGDVVIFGYPPLASEAGSRVITTSIQCFGGAVSCIGTRDSAIGSSYSFERTSGGWVTTALAPSAARLRASASFSYDADSGMALFSGPTEPFGEEDIYVRLLDGSFADIGPETSPAAGPGTGLKNFQATADYSHVAWNANVGAWPFDETINLLTNKTAYEYVGTGNSQPFLLGVSGGQGSTDLISACGTDLPSGVGGMSADGRVVYFVARACSRGSGTNSKTGVPANELYARVDGERSDAHTVAISRRSPSDCTGLCQSSEPSDAGFVGASTDGSKVYFVSTQRLTDGATNGQENLYLYDFDSPAGHNLIDVSAGDTSGARPRVRGVTAISPDGSHVYFLARSVLTASANNQGQTARNGAENLYVFERDSAHPDGRIAFIEPDGAPHNFGNELGVGPYVSNVTPDGRFLVFTSKARLTADDTSVSGAEQVFRYDAQTGELIRISIGNNGFNDNGNRTTPSICQPTYCIEDAHTVPPFALPRRDPTMSNDGSYVFFQSPVGLTPQALDDVAIGKDIEGTTVYAQNVYEWHAGHVYLISDGRDVSENLGHSFSCGTDVSSVCLLGADASGSNVFFATADRLVPSDTDTQLDYYDARVCTAVSPCIKQAPPPLPPCLGEACHGTPAGTPLLPSAPSATFNGQGNLTASPGKVAAKKATGRKRARCARGRRRVRGRCLRAKAKRAKKASSTAGIVGRAKSHKGGK